MRGMLEFQERYGSEAGCIEALARLRWPHGYVCARCAARRSYQLKAARRRSVVFLLCSRRRCRLSASAGACGGLCDARDVGVSRTLRIGGGLH